ncbi:hypothetical protein FP744_10005897 [Trichoderma asperellum]|nr:S-adenosyl-L-methionine-dependent methyltransferase [Trichoderma asperelloides]
MPAPQLRQEALSLWETNAELWNSGIGEHGNKYWKRLQEPSLRRLLGPSLSKPGCAVLELATGNGLCARWLADNGAASVIATDGTFNMLEQAKKYLDADRVGKISFQKLDVTDANDFVPLVEKAAEIGGFDIVLMNMAIMDVATLDPLADALPKLLGKDGVFVATLLHPTFYTAPHSRNLDIKFNRAGDQEIVLSKVIHEYLNVEPCKGVFIVGQEAPQLYFHRPVHELFGVFFKRGLVMDALEEPSFTQEDVVPERLYATANFTQFPALMSFRFKKSY